MSSYLNQEDKPRGIRNNNPGNLIITGNAWEGKLANNTDGHFEQFVDVEHGIRAMAYDIYHDINKGYNTLTSLVSQYAPPFENDTPAYIQAVSKHTGISPDSPILLSEHTLFSIVKAKIGVENGAVAYDYVTDEMITAGINLLPSNILTELKKKTGLPT